MRTKKDRPISKRIIMKNNKNIFLRNNLVFSFVKNLMSFWQSPFFLGVVYNLQYSGKKTKWAIAHFRKRLGKC